MKLNKSLISKYKQSNKIYDLIDGSGIVIGQETDENNKMMYVLKKGDKIELVRPKDCPIIPQIYPSKSTTKKILIPLSSLNTN